MCFIISFSTQRLLPGDFDRALAVGRGGICGMSGGGGDATPAGLDGLEGLEGMGGGP